MIKGNVPNNKKDAEIFLNAKKIQLLELNAKISTGEISTMSQVSAFAWSEIAEIEELIESGDYD